MLFRNLLQPSNDIADNQLIEIENDLKAKIEKAKTLASTCKVSKDSDDGIFTTTSTEIQQLVFPDFKPEINYNEEFWKTYLKNQISFAMIKELSEKTASLQEQVKEIQGLQDEYLKLYKIKNRKKNRRLAVEIQKKFTCPYEKCYKVYGSDVSLNLHIKLKHNGGNKTDRQKLAEQICLAEEKGEPLPQMRLNLPPQYLDQFKQSYFTKKQSGQNINSLKDEKLEEQDEVNHNEKKVEKKIDHEIGE